MSKCRVTQFIQFECAFDDLEEELPEYAHKYLRPAFRGDVDAAASLAFAANPGFQRDLLVVKAYHLRIPPPAFSKLLREALTHFSGRGLLAMAGSRPRLTRMCRYAGIDLPASIPARPTIYRGIQGILPEEGAAGLHWSLSFECAAFFATRYQNRKKGCVLTTKIHRAEIVFYSAGRNEDEVIPEKAPLKYEVTEDQNQIAEAAALYRASMAHTQGSAGTCMTTLQLGVLEQSLAI